jgi:hypothetical protein
MSDSQGRDKFTVTWFVCIVVRLDDRPISFLMLSLQINITYGTLHLSFGNILNPHSARNGR